MNVVDRYVYVDYTTESLPRPFYVGKGTLSRVRKLRRNKKHDSVALKYGLRREVVLGPVSNDEACLEEIRLIEELKTHHQQGNLGANFTYGGDGACRIAPMTAEQRKRISESWTEERKEETSRRMRENNPMKDVSISAPVVEKLIKLHTGRKKSSEEIERCRQAKLGSKNPAYGKPQSEEAKRKNAESNRKRALAWWALKKAKQSGNSD